MKQLFKLSLVAGLMVSSTGVMAAEKFVTIGTGG